MFAFKYQLNKLTKTMILSRNIFTVKRLVQNIRKFHCSQKCGSYEGSGKTRGEVININPGPRLFIKEVSQIGFVLNDNSKIIGPLAIFPRSAFCWNIPSGEHINEKTLSLFFTIEPKLDLLILGLERKYEHKEIMELKKMLAREGMNTEICSVEQACGLYNLICDEGRFVAAGLIPPVDVKLPVVSNS
nr:NADH dehydrogenase [ubiquinone] 1 alpha subcomplex assembly factor 3 [Nomia melanderi]